MLLAIIILFSLLVMCAISLISCIIGGLSLVMTFGDVIIFVVIVYLIIKVFKRK